RERRQAREGPRQLGRGPPRLAGPHPRGQGARGASGTPGRGRAGRARAGGAGPAPPRAHELPRRGGRGGLAPRDRGALARDEGMTPAQPPLPALLARLGPLQVTARKVMEGVLTGLHKSPHHGQSVEFSEHKEYAPGDEIRHIDWRAFAKLDKYYVKRFEMETNLRALLVVDGSGSMAYGRGAMTKLQYGAVCAGALAYLLARQGDQVGLIVAGDADEGSTERLPSGVRSFLPFAASTGHVQEVLRRLDAAVGRGPTDLSFALDFAAEKAGRRGMVVVLSDLFDPTERSLLALKMLR